MRGLCRTANFLKASAFSQIQIAVLLSFEKPEKGFLRDHVEFKVLKALHVFRDADLKPYETSMMKGGCSTQVITTRWRHLKFYSAHCALGNPAPVNFHSDNVENRNRPKSKHTWHLCNQEYIFLWLNQTILGKPCPTIATLLSDEAYPAPQLETHQIKPSWSCLKDVEWHPAGVECSSQQHAAKSKATPGSKTSGSWSCQLFFNSALLLRHHLQQAQHKKMKHLLVHNC